MKRFLLSAAAILLSLAISAQTDYYGEEPERLTLVPQ